MESMADEDFKFFTMGETELKVFRDGRLQYLEKRSKVWKDKKSSDNNGYLQTKLNGKTVFSSYYNRFVLFRRKTRR